jgi:hypothetical protein
MVLIETTLILVLVPVTKLYNILELPILLAEGKACFGYGLLQWSNFRKYFTIYQCKQAIIRYSISW